MAGLRRRSIVGLLGLIALLAVSGSVEAQMRAGSAEIVRATAPADVLPKGQTAWRPAAVGARLVEGDQVRALVGGSVEMTLPDGSTILVAENTRFAVAKLDYDAASRDRNASFHLVAGKVRAQVSQAAVTLARTRQSNFNISTPTGVAAVRGTITVVASDPRVQQTLMFVLPSPGQAPSAARVTYFNRAGQSVTVTGGHFMRQVGTQPPGQPASINSMSAAAQAAVLASQNPATANLSELTALNVSIPSHEEIQNTTGGAGAGGGPGASGDRTELGDTITGGGPGTCDGCGRDVAESVSGGGPPPVVCATPPCPPSAGRPIR